jgi:hypothetical protein
MRRALVTLAFIGLALVAADAPACSRCSTMPDNCDTCYEALGDGGINCYLWQGEYCTIVGPGQCEGVGDDDCEGIHCPEDRWTSREPLGPERDWQLASYEVIRPSPGGTESSTLQRSSSRRSDT